MRWVEGGAQMIENILLLVIAALLLVYLVYALLRPEKF
jgi:K+-transporting ATPase KdpF subunit